MIFIQLVDGRKSKPKSWEIIYISYGLWLGMICIQTVVSFLFASLVAFTWSYWTSNQSLWRYILHDIHVSVKVNMYTYGSQFWWKFLLKWCKIVRPVFIYVSFIYVFITKAVVSRRNALREIHIMCFRWWICNALDFPLLTYAKLQELAALAINYLNKLISYAWY